MSAWLVPGDARLRASARRRAVRPDTLTARVAGVLFIAATVASLLSTGLLNPVFSGSECLFKISAHQDRIVAGGFFEIIAAFASAGIAVSLYPVVRRDGESLALGSVGFRLLEGGLLSRRGHRHVPVAAGGPGCTGRSPGSVVPADLRRAVADPSKPGRPGRGSGVLPGCLNVLLRVYRARLIPRRLSGWGPAGTALGALAGLLVLFRVTGYISAPQVVLNLPIGVNEMVLAIWLLVRDSAPQRPGPRRSDGAVTRAPGPAPAVPASTLVEGGGPAGRS